MSPKASSPTDSASRPVVFAAPGLKRYQTDEFVPRCPGSFRPVSVTGRSCALQCPHCEGRLLQSMAPVSHGDSLYETCARLADNGVTGVLVTGGCDRDGRVPLAGLGPDLARIRTQLGLSVAVHTGLVDRDVARELADAGVERAMLDLIGDIDTARSVYRLDAGPDVYEASLAALVDAGVPTVPHVVIGLHFGEVRGEHAAIAMAGRHAVVGLVLVILTPIPGTAMDGVSPPDVVTIGALFREARAALPHVPVLLGCARPTGPARVAIDRAALDAGLDGIAFPSEGAVAHARGQGRPVVFSESCCSLDALGGCG